MHDKIKLLIKYYPSCYSFSDFDSEINQKIRPKGHVFLFYSLYILENVVISISFFVSQSTFMLPSFKKIRSKIVFYLFTAFSALRDWIWENLFLASFYVIKWNYWPIVFTLIGHFIQYTLYKGFNMFRNLNL